MPSRSPRSSTGAGFALSVLFVFSVPVTKPATLLPPIPAGEGERGAQEGRFLVAASPVEGLGSRSGGAGGCGSTRQVGTLQQS